MLSNQTTLKREELYELVWSNSMLQLAKSFNLSDRGLAKICQRLEIPVPGLGYWAKIAAGHTLERTPLPPLSKDGLESVEVNRPAARVPKIQIEAISPDNTHPLVEQTRLALAEEKAEVWEGCLVNRSSPHLSLRVTPKSLERALNIMNLVLTTLEARGHTISIAQTGAEPLTWVSVDHDRVSISIKERLGQSWTSDQKNRTYTSTGELELSIDYRRGIRTSWRDLTKQKLESFIGAFIESITRIQEEKIETRVAQETYQAKKEKEEREERERANRLKQQRGFLKKIERQAKYWERAEGIRRYLSAFENALEGGEIDASDKGQLKAWIGAGRGLADQLDPITGGWDVNPPEFTEEERDSYASNYLSQPPPKPAYTPWWYVKKSQGWK